MSAQQLQEEGMKQVLDNESTEWQTRYRLLVPEFLKNPPKDLPHYPLFLGEDVVNWMRKQCIGEPHHPSAWGAMFNMSMARSGFLIGTGRFAKGTTEQAHARAGRLWMSTLAQGEDKMITLNKTLLGIKAQFVTKKIDLMEALRRAAEAGAYTIG